MSVISLSHELKLVPQQQDSQQAEKTNCHDLMDIKADFQILQQKYQEIVDHFKDLKDLKDIRKNKKYTDEMNVIIKGIRFDALSITNQKLEVIL